MLILITDGYEDNASKATAAQVAQAAWATDVIVYGFVVQREDGIRLQNTARMRQMTGEIARVTDPTGGSTVFVQGFGELEDHMDRLGREVTSQYFLEYQRQGERDGKFREIVVQVDRPNVNVQHRRGYIAN